MFSLFQYKKKGKTPVIRQHEFTECGLACLAMVLGHYEHHVSVSQLRRELTVSADAGTSMAELMTLASDKNMTGRVLKCRTAAHRLLARQSLRGDREG